jgi:transcriptional regulator
MHPNTGFRWTDQAAILAFVGETGFARIFAETEDGPRVAHVPVLVREGPVLHFHLANGNALAKAIDGRTALALIEGPNAYLSANWYADVKGAVPTWNYVAVECEGPVQRQDREALVALVDDLALHLEPKVGEDWTRAKMEPKRFEAMLGAITAFALRIETMRGTRKLSQNKPDDEVARVLAGLEANGAHAMADAMRAVRS